MILVLSSFMKRTVATQGVNSYSLTQERLCTTSQAKASRQLQVPFVCFLTPLALKSPASAPSCVALYRHCLQFSSLQSLFLLYSTRLSPVSLLRWWFDGIRGVFELCSGTVKSNRRSRTVSIHISIVVSYPDSITSSNIPSVSGSIRHRYYFSER